MDGLFEVPKDWCTPATFYPERTVGKARIKRTWYRKGAYYHMHGVCGYKLFTPSAKLPVTNLQTFERGAWRTWMVDDPLHWEELRNFSMRAAKWSEKSSPRILVAGLGLGLILHHLYRNTPNANRVVVVERDPDVISLVGPLLPPWRAIDIIEADFWSWTETHRRRRWDTIIIDLWRGRGTACLPDMLNRREWLHTLYPRSGTLSLFFGAQGVMDRLNEMEDLVRAVHPNNPNFRRRPRWTTSKSISTRMSQPRPFAPSTENP